MATNGGQLQMGRSSQACVTCKTRKKKCNKFRPSCGYCLRRGLECSYPAPEERPPIPYRIPVFDFCGRPPLNPIFSRTKPPPTDCTADELRRYDAWITARHVISSSGQFIDEISTRYFHGFHPHLPIISRERFHNSLLTLGASSAPDLSLLLLAICLVTYCPALGHHIRDGIPRPHEQEHIYSQTREVFSEDQVICSPSVTLIQAGLLLAVYEYTQGRPDHAFVTIAASVRLAYAARIHLRHNREQGITPRGRHAANSFLVQDEESANLWWALVVCERIILAEVTVFDQPLLSVMPGGDDRLPIDYKVLDQLGISDPATVPNVPMACLTSAKVGGFGRTAQAVSLLDQVFKGLKISDIDTKLLLLDRLDSNIRAFLALVMPQCQEQPGIFCSSTTIAMRALFVLHLHILTQPPQAVSANFQSQADWYRRSQKALDTVTKMVVDVAQSCNGDTGTLTIDLMPPTYPYVARAALKHIYNSENREDIDWMGSAKQVLQISLDRYTARWNVGGDLRH